MDAVPALRPDWIHAIEVVRRYYHGPVTYGADYVHYQQVAFWNALNEVGIDAYFPLANTHSPSLAQLEASWTTIGNQIETWRKTSHLTSKPFIITELGYYSGLGAASQPGSWTPHLPANLGIQTELYEATYDSIYRRPWVSGLFWFWWANASNPDWQGGSHDNGYTPRGKPAEIVIRQNFT